MKVFVLAEWVFGESVVLELCCSRTRVFKSCIYDSAKGWGFTESQCFFLHLNINRSIYLNSQDVYFV